MSEEYLTVKEASVLLKVQKITIYRNIKRGKIRAGKILGKQIRIKRSEIERILEG